MEFLYLEFTHMVGESYRRELGSSIKSINQINLYYSSLSLCLCDVFRFEDVTLVKFMYFEFTRMPGESYCRELGSLLLCLCDVFRALINSLVC